jgi:hypothetical protein
VSYVSPQAVLAEMFDHIDALHYFPFLVYTIIVFLDIIHNPIFIENTQRFGDSILSPSSGGSYSVGPNR